MHLQAAQLALMSQLQAELRELQAMKFERAKSSVGEAAAAAATAAADAAQQQPAAPSQSQPAAQQQAGRSTGGGSTTAAAAAAPTFAEASRGSVPSAAVAGGAGAAGAAAAPTFPVLSGSAGPADMAVLNSSRDAALSSSHASSSQAYALDMASQGGGPTTDAQRLPQYAPSPSTLANARGSASSALPSTSLMYFSNTGSSMMLPSMPEQLVAAGGTPLGGTPSVGGGRGTRKSLSMEKNHTHASNAVELPKLDAQNGRQAASLGMVAVGGGSTAGYSTALTTTSGAFAGQYLDSARMPEVHGVRMGAHAALAAPPDNTFLLLQREDASTAKLAALPGTSPQQSGAAAGSPSLQSAYQRAVSRGMGIPIAEPGSGSGGPRQLSAGNLHLSPHILLNTASSLGSAMAQDLQAADGDGVGSRPSDAGWSELLGPGEDSPRTSGRSRAATRGPSHSRLQTSSSARDQPPGTAAQPDAPMAADPLMAARASMADAAAAALAAVDGADEGEEGGAVESAMGAASFGGSLLAPGAPPRVPGGVAADGSGAMAGDRQGTRGAHAASTPATTTSATTASSSSNGPSALNVSSLTGDGLAGGSSSQVNTGPLTRAGLLASLGSWAPTSSARGSGEPLPTASMYMAAVESDVHGASVSQPVQSTALSQGSITLGLHQGHLPRPDSSGAVAGPSGPASTGSVGLLAKATPASAASSMRFEGLPAGHSAQGSSIAVSGSESNLHAEPAAAVGPAGPAAVTARSGLQYAHMPSVAAMQAAGQAGAAAAPVVINEISEGPEPQVVAMASAYASTGGRPSGAHHAANSSESDTEYARWLMANGETELPQTPLSKQRSSRGNAHGLYRHRHNSSGGSIPVAGSQGSLSSTSASAGPGTRGSSVSPTRLPHGLPASVSGNQLVAHRQLSRGVSKGKSGMFGGLLQGESSMAESSIPDMSHADTSSLEFLKGYSEVGRTCTSRACMAVGCWRMHPFCAPGLCVWHMAWLHAGKLQQSL